MSNETAGSQLKGQSQQDSGGSPTPQRVRITLNGGDTDTSCRGIDQESDARERADRIVSIFRTGNNQHGAISDILDRTDADDAAYREIRRAVTLLQADARDHHARLNALEASANEKLSRADLVSDARGGPGAVLGEVVFDDDGEIPLVEFAHSVKCPWPEGATVEVRLYTPETVPEGEGREVVGMRDDWGDEYPRGGIAWRFLEGRGLGPESPKAWDLKWPSNAPHAPIYAPAALRSNPEEATDGE